MTSNDFYCLDLLAEPRGSVYHDLLDAMAAVADRASVVIRPSIPVFDSVSSLMARLEPVGVLKETVSSWPGTQLVDNDVDLLKFDYGAAIAILHEHSNALYDWLQPDLPEDLALYRSDGSVCLLSCSHEHFAELHLSDHEMAPSGSLLNSLKYTIMDTNR